ncbi:MAG TPA: glycosyltransferase 87 family protein [Candidatus Acidoferrales bacterium]
MVPTENFPARLRISQTQILLAALILLEALFWRLRRFGNLETFVVETIATGLAAGVIYFIAIYGLEHTREGRWAFWLVLAAGILFRATLWPLAPTLSNDLYRYRFDGLVQLAGENPYLTTPDDARLRGLRNPTDLNETRMPGQEIPTIYPPLAELVFRMAARFLPGAVAFKLPMEAADVLTMILLAAWLRSTGGRAYQLAIYAWNPLVIIEFAASGHSDALALVALVGAFVIIKSKPMLSTMLLACAALLKSFPIMLFPLWLWRQGWPKSRRAWASGFASAALAAVCTWPYRAALHQIPVTMAYFESRWQDNNASLYTILKFFTHSHAVAAGIGVGVAIGLALWTAIRGVDPARAAFWIFGAILLFSPNAYSWYFTWVIPFLCFYPNAAWLLLTVLQFLSYQVLIDYSASGRWHFDPRYVALTYAPFYALLLCRALRSRGHGSPLGLN